MDISGINSGHTSRTNESLKAEGTKDGARAGAKRVSAASGDSFATSSTSKEVGRLVERLSVEGESRTEMVDQFRALLKLGQLDTPENINQAADGLLEEF